MAGLLMRGIDPPRRSLAKLAGATLGTAALVMLCWHELEVFWFPNQVSEGLRWFYSLRGFVLGGCCGLAGWLVIRQHREHAQKASVVFHDFVENTSEAVIGSDQSGRINYANPAAHRIFGYERLNGKSITVLMPEHYHAQHRAGLMRVLAPPHETRIAGKERILEGLRESGHVFPVAITITVLPGRPMQYFALIRDLSSLREVAEHVL